MRTHDWSASPLGPPSTWPRALRTLVRLVLDARQAMFLAWGPDLAFLYNDAYAPIFGAKHPQALGRPFAEVWSDIWPQIKPLVDDTLAGRASWHEDLLIPMERHGYREDAYFSFSYTPAYGDDGRVAGMFCAATETTRKVLAERHLASESERLRELFQQAPGFMAVLRGPEHRFEMVNDSYEQLVGHRDIVGKPVLEALPEVAGQGFKELLDQVYRTGEPYVGSNLPIMLQREPGSSPELRFVDFVYQPIRDTQQRVSGIFAEGIDVTEARRSEAALRESEQRLRLALDAGRMAVWESDTGTNTIKSSPELNRLLGLPADATPTADEIRARYAPGARERLQAAAVAALQRGECFAEDELEVIWPDGSHRWLLLRAEIEVVAPGRLRAIGVAMDITARKRAEEHQRLLINELNHRVKNTLATVQSVASQSLRGARSPEEARAALESRLLALSRAHDVLTRENWESAGLKEIVTQAMLPFTSTRAGRVHTSGPDVRLPPRTALAIAMALQELATNAVKYGALSREAGNVEIRWTATTSEERRLHLTWEERGGPPVTPPKRRGFGTRLIERSLAQDLNGRVVIAFEPTGLICTVDAALP
ncbi:MAG: PAS domain-containing protein [Pseudomonadota bacterium]|nr:PAS domain-containing protein [Pseudomonadota bacterium]